MSDTRGGPWARRLGTVGAATVLIGGLTLVVTTPPAAAFPAVMLLGQSSWAYVDSRAPDTTHLNENGDAPVGKVHPERGGDRVARSYFTFDVSRLRGTQVSRVELFDAETRATDCVHRSVEVWTTAPITANTTWSNQPAWQQKIDTAKYLANTICPAPRIEWDATAAVQRAVMAGRDTLTLGLRATNEDETDFGRWFDHDLRMSVEYDTPPGTPAPSGVSAHSFETPTPCGTSSPGAWVNGLQPILYARVSDADNQQVDLTSAVWPVEDPSRRTIFPGGSAWPWDVARGQVPAGVLTDGGSYAWSAQATDTEGLTSDWSEPCYFSVDVTRPDHAPVITSTDYPADGATHGGEGIPGTFTFTPNGVADVARYAYDWSGVGPQGIVAADHLGGSATIALAPPQAPISILHVASLDKAGNRSDDMTYEIYTRKTAPLVTVVTAQPKAGGTGRLEVQPGFSLPGYEVTGYTYTVNQGESVSVAARSDGTATIDVPLNYGSNQIEVKSVSANGWVSPVSTAYFYADNSPTISSADFPENADGGAVGRTGTFTLTSNLRDSTTFYYSFDYGSTWESLPVGPDGRASFDWTPDTAGWQYLMAYSQTADGTQSDWYFYSFNVAG